MRAIRYDWKGNGMVVLHNLSSRPCTVKLDPGGDETCSLYNVLTEDHSQPVDGQRHTLTPEGYGYRWFRVGQENPARKHKVEPHP